MNAKVLLAYLSDAKYGGWPTFTHHLSRGIQGAGHAPLIVKVGGSHPSRLAGLPARSMPIEAIQRLATHHPTLITAMDAKHHDEARALLDVGAHIVIHDPTELKPGIRDDLKRVLIIRESMLAHLPDATFIPHPYVNAPVPQNRLRGTAISISRVDFDKHTEMICAANALLAEEDKILIGGFVNRLYEYHHLRQEFPDWKRTYVGPFIDPVSTAARYQSVVDMSVIKGDGGGTQYTFLEAANAGCRLILNAEWAPTGALADYAETVASPEELALAVTMSRPAQGAGELLAQHSATRIGQRVVSLLE